MEDFKQVVFEALLGDGTLYIPHECKNARFEYRQVVQHSDEVYKRAAAFDPHTGVTMSFTKEPRPDRQPSRGFYTAVKSVFTEVRDDVYKASVKYIPEEYANRIRWRGLAWWYVDDGSLDIQRNGHKVSASFATDGFTKRDCEILQEAVHRNLDVFLHIHKAKVNRAGQQTYRMRVSKSTFDLFMEGIRAYVVPSFYYKLAVREAPGTYTRMKIQSDLTGDSKSEAEMSRPVTHLVAA